MRARPTTLVRVGMSADVMDSRIGWGGIRSIPHLPVTDELDDYVVPINVDAKATGRSPQDVLQPHAHSHSTGQDTKP